MKRLSLLFLGVLVLSIGGRVLYRALASDETKIRWLVERMVAGYNTGDVGDCVGPLAPEWRHEDSALDRETLRMGLVQSALQDRDPATKALNRRVELDPASLSIAVDGPGATLRATASFARARAGVWSETWRVELEAELTHGTDGWKIVRSRQRDQRGTQLSR